MKGLLQQYSNKGIFWSLFFIIITFPLPFKISNLGLVALVLAWIVKLISERSIRFNITSTNHKIIFFSFIGFFIWQIISLLYTDDLQNGLKNVESKLTLLILPLVFYSIRLTQLEVRRLILAYLFSIALCTVVLFAESFYHYFSNGTLLTYHDFTRSLDFHAVFYSYDLFLSILLAVFLIRTSTLNKRENVFVGISIFLFIAGLVISASKNVLVVTTLFLIVGYVLKAMRKRFSLKEFGLLVGGATVIVIVCINIPSIGGRIKQLGEMNGMDTFEKVREGEMIDYKDVSNFNGTSMRLTFWYVAIKKQFEEGELLLGYSPGDRRAVINEEFFKNGLNPWYENYNLHNQFVQVMVELGLVGLLLYLLIHVGFLQNALKNRNYLLLAFVIGICFFQITESIIERNKGIVFIVFFLLFLERINLQLDENRNHRN